MGDLSALHWIVVPVLFSGDQSDLGCMAILERSAIDSALNKERNTTEVVK
jgi:hypothetical protein